MPKFPQKSRSFILPYLNISTSGAKANGLIETYMGGEEKDSDEWTKNFYVLTTDPTPMLDYEFTESPFYDKKVDVDDGTLYIFKYEDNFRENVVLPFVAGKYSEIDRNYVSIYFPRTYRDGDVTKRFRLRRILDKDPSMRFFWYLNYGIVIPEDGEVWSRPEKESEIYRGKSLSKDTQDVSKEEKAELL